ncbi:hypothetical protein Taro_023631 [Colocasia esculenta]|uniref:Uncharacterized protein n=1 Tax=Colocasia esculenta TaxID=4460 RepID=A0A843VBD5_COLES|nr:hypothetical protein [Colocasia esculenta]
MPSSVSRGGAFLMESTPAVLTLKMAAAPPSTHVRYADDRPPFNGCGLQLLPCAARVSYLKGLRLSMPAGSTELAGRGRGSCLAAAVLPLCVPVSVVLLFGLFIGLQSITPLPVADHDTDDGSVPTYTPPSRPSPVAASSINSSRVGDVKSTEKAGGDDDEELLRRASSTAAEYSNSGCPRKKVAFMFLTKGRMPLRPLWELFFRGHEECCSIYVHTSPEFAEEPPEGSVFSGRRIRSKALDVRRRTLGRKAPDIQRQPLGRRTPGASRSAPSTGRWVAGRQEPSHWAPYAKSSGVGCRTSDVGSPGAGSPVTRRRPLGAWCWVAECQLVGRQMLGHRVPDTGSLGAEHQSSDVESSGVGCQVVGCQKSGRWMLVTEC